MALLLPGISVNVVSKEVYCALPRRLKRTTTRVRTNREPFAGPAMSESLNAFLASGIRRPFVAIDRLFHILYGTIRHACYQEPCNRNFLPPVNSLDCRTQGSIMGISTFGLYRTAYPVRSPQVPSANADEDRLLGASDGVQFFSDAPCLVQPQDINPSPKDPDERKRCLWVILGHDVPFIRECLSATPPLQSGVCKHTNLTGAGSAHCGGEVWFVSRTRLILNGASGRYPPRDETELMKIAMAFQNAGYEIWSMGWDTETNRPARVTRGTPPWKTRN